MHIKQITLSNFRSFKKQPEIHPFSATTNAIVGRNGSGKSNLFDAVQFVLLAPKFWTLRTVSDDGYSILFYSILFGIWNCIIFIFLKESKWKSHPVLQMYFFQIFLWISNLECTLFLQSCTHSAHTSHWLLIHLISKWHTTHQFNIQHN